MLTHELVSQISFGLYDLKMLIQYHNFRKKYNIYTDAELAKIIDKNDLSIQEKKELTKEKSTDNINAIRKAWSATFENMSYKKLKKEINLQ